MLKTVGHILTAVLVGLLLAGCGIYDDPVEDIVVDEPSVVLSLNIEVSDAPAVKGYADPEFAGEMMQTLRIVIVRPDGIVEHNRLLDLASDPKLLVTDQKFEVKGNELKDVYLIANESNLKSKSAFDFSLIPAGGVIQSERMASLAMSMGSNEDLLELPVPMSASYKIMMPQTDVAADLEIFRSAAKFTFRFINETEYTYDLTSIKISKAAHKEFFFPSEITLGDYSYTESGVTVTGSQITEYSVPSDAGYYDFVRNYDSHLILGWAGSGKLNAPEVCKLTPLYIFEGKHVDEASDGKNYKVTFVLNGREFEKYLPSLSELPRNTHAVVTARLTEQGVLDWFDVNLDVDVRPYTELPYGDVELEPGFGL